MWGSSPLTRGKLKAWGGDTILTGLIPAHAGKTSTWSRTVQAPGAHPRSRGENEHADYDARLRKGSSPLTRGKRFVFSLSVVWLGLIPAHAGKTYLILLRIVPRQAHPRSRGENKFPGERREYGYGSSPLTRGKRHPLRPRLRDRGLIPAHAGKTEPSRGHAVTTAAHPRSRGENINLVVSALSGWGSSPLTRGKRNGRDGGSRRTGLIPAHAGKTLLEVTEKDTIGAHPRSRGENFLIVEVAEKLDGSSPLTRGKLHPKTGKPLDDGLIPAHAGKTEAERKRYSDDGAHPRSRGENNQERS